MRLVFTRDVDGFDKAVAVDNCGKQRHVIVVRDAFPILSHSELFRLMASQGGNFKEGSIEKQKFLDLDDCLPMAL